MMNRRLVKELEMLAVDPGPGIAVWKNDESINNLFASMTGPENSPYEDGVFQLSVNIPDRYPFEPPNVRFITPVYHPNIDNDGRICLDTLKMQPQGSWSPSININTLLITIRVLLGCPNADDGLVPDITEQYRRDVVAFRKDAKLHTLKHAVSDVNDVYNGLDNMKSDSCKISNDSSSIRLNGKEQDVLMPSSSIGYNLQDESSSSSYSSNNERSDDDDGDDDDDDDGSNHEIYSEDKVGNVDENGEGKHKDKDKDGDRENEAQDSTRESKRRRTLSNAKGSAT